MRRRLLYLLPLLLFLVVAGYFVLGLGRNPAYVPSALLSKPVPEFTLPPLAGREARAPEGGLTTADLKQGEVTIVNVFASWCVPCRIEHPFLTKLAQEQGVRIHAINYKDKPEDAVGWLQRLGDPYGRIGADRDGRAAIEWGVYGVPETFVVDGTGTIRYRFAGPLDPGEIERNLLPLLRKLRG
jgi:cytochrome c biogenesis protein CcmG, thiol:disulfide interchange protein DsbE